MRQRLSMEGNCVRQINDKYLVISSDSKRIRIFGMPFDCADGVTMFGRRWNAKQEAPAVKVLQQKDIFLKIDHKLTEHHR